MRKQLFLLAFGSTMLLNSCEVTINENSSSGNETHEAKNGFSYEEIDRSINGILPVKNNEVIAGEYLIIKFDGIANATLKDGYQHLGIGLQVYGPDGKLYDEAEDLLSNIEQQDPNIDNCHFYFGIPEEFAGEQMRIDYQLYDKYGDVSYDFSDEYDVINQDPPITENVKIESSLEADIKPQIFQQEYQKEKCPLEVAGNFELKMFLIDVSGFTISDLGEVNLSYRIALENADGVEEFSKEDKLHGSVEGAASYPLTFSLNYENLPKGNYVWKVHVEDDLGEHYINVSAPLIVE